jgi:hypothetical protein
MLSTSNTTWSVRTSATLRATVMAGFVGHPLPDEGGSSLGKVADQGVPHCPQG